MTSTTRLRAHLRSPGPASTQALAAALARAARPGDLICLRGDLGAGKTQFAKGFARGLGVTAVVNSPSFVLMAEHTGRLPLFHVDLYRLGDAADAIGGGLLDERQAGGVTLIEWPERLGSAVPPVRLDVTFEGLGDEPRTIDLEATHPSLERYLEAADVWAAETATQAGAAEAAAAEAGGEGAE